MVGTFSFFSGVLSLKLLFPNPVNNNQTEKDTRRAFLLTQKKEMLAKQGHKYARRHKKLGVGYNFDLIKPWLRVKKQQFEMDRFCALNVMNYYATKGTQLPAEFESVVGIVPLLITEIWPVAVAPAVKIPAQYLLGLGLNRQQ